MPANALDAMNEREWETAKLGEADDDDSLKTMNLLRQMLGRPVFESREHCAACRNAVKPNVGSSRNS